MTIDWQARLETFLAIREALGLVSRPARILLQDFISHIESHHIPVPVPAQVIVEWATSSRGASGHCARLSLARLFLEHVRAFVPETIVPPKGLLATRRRPHPYLFAPEDICRLMESPITIRPHYTLRPYLVRTLVGLLASTGIRIGEALNLRVRMFHWIPPRLSCISGTPSFTNPDMYPSTQPWRFNSVNMPPSGKPSAMLHSRKCFLCRNKAQR